MTEIERIISKDMFSKDFIKPETLCNFYVDEKRKKVWLISLDLLSEFDRVCKIHGLRYFLMFGTLLGAIRHRGFIPWDDDIDVVMPREDYEKLSLWHHNFTPPYFLQTPQTDKGYYYSFNKLRNSNTTNMPIAFRYEHFNQGISLDIFPLDYYTMENIEEKFAKIKELAIDLSNYMRMRNPELDEDGMERIAQYSGRPPIDTLQMIQDVCREDAGKKCDMIGWMSGNIYGPFRQTFKKESFIESQIIDFYGLHVPIPKAYHYVLTTLYGNYMEFPPVSVRGTWHHHLIQDTDNPYTHYIKSK